jgi:hypothetical protein
MSERAVIWFLLGMGVLLIILEASGRINVI